MDASSYRERLELLEEENLQLKQLLAPAIALPREWKLTVSEDALLRHLLARPLVTAESAMVALYGFESEIEPKIVDVFICKLRRKVKPVGLEISTRWGVGYELIDRVSWRARLEENDMSNLSVSIVLDDKQYAAIAKRAATVNIKPGEYVRRCFQAGYLARCGADKGEPTGEAALDRAVRDVFLLADCEPEYIAEATGLAQDLVEKIIAGWRGYAAERDGARAPADTKDTPSAVTDGRDEQRDGCSGDAAMPVPPPAPPEKRPTRWSEEERSKLKEMWAAGAEAAEIGAALGRPASAVQQYAGTHRDLCPKRR